MKILISNDSPVSAHFYERQALMCALGTCNEVILWNIWEKSDYDIFDEFEPDIFIGQAYNLTKPLIRCIEERPALRVLLKASDWSDFHNPFPILFASTEEKDLVNDLRNKTGRPDFLFIHYHPDYLEQTHGNWMKNGYKVVSLMNAADTVNFRNGQKLPEFESDITFVGGYWPYKSYTLDRYILPLVKKFRTKIFGNSTWPSEAYCGTLRAGFAKHALASASICPNTHEMHSQKLGWDIIERPFKLLANRCFCISDYVEGLEKLFPDSIVYGRTPEEFIEKVEFFLKNPVLKVDYIDKGYKQVVANHTYFDRAATIFENLNLNAAREEILEQKLNYI